MTKCSRRCEGWRWRMENHWVRCGEIGLDVIILWQMRVGGRGKETKCLKRRDRRERFEASGRMASMFRCIFHEATTAPAYTMVHAIFRRRTSASFDASHKLACTNHLLSQERIWTAGIYTRLPAPSRGLTRCILTI